MDSRPVDPLTCDPTTLFKDTAAALAKAALVEECAKAVTETFNECLEKEASAAVFAACLSELSKLHADKTELWAYLYLREGLDGRDSELQDLLAAAERGELAVARSAEVVVRAFTSLAATLTEATGVTAAATLLDDPALAPYRAFLAATLTEAKLSPEAEAAVSAFKPQAVSAWAALAHEQRMQAKAPLEAGLEPLSAPELLRLEADEDPKVRRQASAALAAAFTEQSPLIARALDAVFASRLAEDALRGRARPEEEALRRDGVDLDLDELLAACEAGYEILHRWYRRRADEAGVTRLERSERDLRVRAHPLEPANVLEVTFKSVSATSPELGRRVKRMAELGRFDLLPGENKSPGAVGASRRVPAYVVCEGQDLLGALVFVHELGHALHFDLCLEAQDPLVAEPGLIASEVPALLAEQMLFELLLREPQPGWPSAAELARYRLERTLSALLPQAMMARFEQRLYETRAAGTPLTPERISAVWVEERTRLDGGLIDYPPGASANWAALPHFFHERFYTYSYVVAGVVALALLTRYRQDPDAFAADYLELLRAGGAERPDVLFARAGVDLGPDLYATAFAELESQLESLL